MKYPLNLNFNFKCNNEFSFRLKHIQLKNLVIIIKAYGISQNPDTKDYTIILQDGTKYTNEDYKWCKTCQIDNLKKKLTSASGNEKIDKLIQEMQLKINNSSDIAFFNF